ncbi:MAG: His/Gly/Thr/Pro-type tRNA ligase C-terminal domain-containing protein, partial [Bacillota bacterium]
PRMLDHLCDACAAHFESLNAFLIAAELDYGVDTGIVRGLDYYTRTVFEITTDYENGTLTVCGGGRYDGLMEELGGPSIPAVGFGMGMERVLMLLDALTDGKRILKAAESTPDVYIAPLDQSLAPTAFHLLKEFRELGLKADMNHTTRGLRAQFKYADKLNASFVAILGEDEAKKGVIKLRDMKSGDEWEADLKLAACELKERIRKQSEEEISP